MAEKSLVPAIICKPGRGREKHGTISAGRNRKRFSNDERHSLPGREIVDLGTTCT